MVFHKGATVYLVKVAVKLIGDIIAKASNEVGDHDGYDDESENVVQIQDEILVHYGFIVALVRLELLKQFAESGYVNELDKSWHSENSDQFGSGPCLEDDVEWNN